MPQYPCGKCNLCESGEYIHCLDTFDIESFTGISEGGSTLAEYIVKPSWLLPKIPHELTYDQASMICCGLGPTYGAIDRLNLSQNDTVLIAGMGPVGLGGIINIKDFAKVELRVAKIVKAEGIEEADKLIKLHLDVGDLGERTVFAGIKSAYDPENLNGRHVVLVANLEPRKMKFGVSEGMVLASSDEGSIYLISPDEGAKPGQLVK